MLLVILLVVVSTGLVEILGFPLAAACSDIITSFRSLSTMAGLMMALDMRDSRGLHTRRTSPSEGVGSGAPPSANRGLLWSSSSMELLEEEPSEGVSLMREYLGYLGAVVLLLAVAGTSVTGSGSDGLDPVDSVSEAEE